MLSRGAVGSDDAYIEEHRPLVLSIVDKVVRQFNIQGPRDDLIADGFRGLIEARSRFDAGRGVQFSTFAYYRIRGAIIDGVRRNSPLPRRLYAKLRAAQSADEITEILGQERSKTPQVRTDAKQTILALDDTLSNIAQAYALAAMEQPEHVVETAEENLLSAESAHHIRAALDALNPRERALIERFYFKGETLESVGKEFGISKSWASRIHTKALTKIRAHYESAMGAK